MHSSPGAALFIVMTIYLVGIGLVIYLSVRWSRRRLRARDDALAAGLTATGARHVGTGSPGGYYTGTEREYELDGQRVLARTSAVSRYYYRANLRVATPPMPGITVFPEGAVERFGKAIGLNRELQTGDSVFDDAAYVDTIEPDEAPVRRVFESPEVRTAVRRLLDLGYKVQLGPRGVEAFQLVAHGTPPDVSQIGKVVALLQQIAGALPRLEAGSFRGMDPFLKAKGLGLALLWAPVLVLAGAVDALAGSPGSRTLSMGHKGFIVGLAALTAWIVYVVLMALWLRGRSYAFRVLLITAFLGLLGIPTFGVLGVLALNQALDNSPAEAHLATVTRASSYRRSCALYVGSWTGDGVDQRLPVACKLLGRFPRGTSVGIREHAGALGMPWIEPIRAED